MDHSALARPVKDVNTPVVVKFGFEILHVVSVVESEQSISQKVSIIFPYVFFIKRGENNSEH